MEALDQKEAESKIEQMLFSTVRDYRVNKVLVEEKLDVAQEFYLGITYDTVAKEPIAIFSAEGGVDIEHLAEEKPEKIQKRHFSVRTGLPEYKAREMISQSNITGKTLLGLSNIFSLLATTFLENDATIAEINPLAQTKDGKRVALDCHLEVDDDAFYRNPGIAKKEKDPHRVEGGRITSDFEKKQLRSTIWIREGLPEGSSSLTVVSNTRADLIARGVIKGILEVGKNPSETLSVFRVPGAWVLRSVVNASRSVRLIFSHQMVTIPKQ